MHKHLSYALLGFVTATQLLGSTLQQPAISTLSIQTQSTEQKQAENLETQPSTSQPFSYKTADIGYSDGDYHEAWPANPPFGVFYQKDNKKVCFIGTYHTDQKTGPVFSLIHDLIDELKPTAVLLEGVETQEIITNEQDTKPAYDDDFTEEHGTNEIGYAHWCAIQIGSTVTGLEADDEEVAQHLEKVDSTYSKQDLAAYIWTTWMCQLRREQRITSPADTAPYFKAWCNQYPTLKPHMPNEKAYNAWLEKNFSQKPTWKKLVSESFTTPAKQGNRLQQIARQTVHIRDCHMMDVLANTLKEHDCVVIVCGAAHYSTQKKALETYFGVADEYMCPDDEDSAP